MQPIQSFNVSPRLPEVLEPLRELAHNQIGMDELETAPQAMPSGWAAVLYLFELR